MEYVNNADEPGILRSVDYAKAFDSISKEFLVKALNVFGFGDMFINWVRTLNSNTQKCINHYGCISDFFD